MGDCVALALEAGDALRRRVNGPSAGGSFRSFAEVELWFGSMQDAYNLTVEKLSAQLRLGVADEEIRETIGEVNTLFADARNSRPTLSAVTASQSTIQMLQEASGNEDVMSSAVRPAQSWPSPSSTESSWRGDWPKIVKSVIAELPPKDIEAIIKWGENSLRPETVALEEDADPHGIKTTTTRSSRKVSRPCSTSTCR